MNKNNKLSVKWPWLHNNKLYTNITVLSLLLAIGSWYFTNNAKASGIAYQKSGMIALPKGKQLGAFPVKVPTMKWGFAMDTMQAEGGEIQQGQFFGELLQDKGFSYPQIEALTSQPDSVFDFRQFRVGKPYAFLTPNGKEQARYLIYEPSVYAFYVFDIQEGKIHRTERTIDKTPAVAAGRVDGSLWNTMVSNGLSYELTAKLEDALQWSVDFHHVQQGDVFKAIYVDHSIEGKKVGVGQVDAAYYETGGNKYFAFYYDNGEDPGYYDSEGRPMNKSFLKAPVKYSRISSYYNLNRFHPILKRRRPHFGTDYAAPYGTPIYAVGDGVVTKASFTRGNGNFVKIKHNDTYETQYLHMQKFAKGISPGVHVKQGQVIGYVGSTGLATGPHVCFRFWQNGKQVNHLKLNFPPPKPLPEKDMPGFIKARDAYLAKLKGIAVPDLPVEESMEDGSANP